MSKIAFEHITKSFPPSQLGISFTALADLDLAVGDHEFLVLVGPSGCGKSTLLDLAAGLTRPTSGQILLDGKPIEGPGTNRGTVFQQYALFPWRTALGNIEFGLEAIKVARKERKERAHHFLALVGLSEFGNHYPHQLSGGMKQRIAIARSLSYNPAVLLMDEPFGALDAQTRELLQDELLRIWEATRKTIIFITHDIDEAIYLGQRVAVMAANPGRIIELIDVPFGHSRRDEDVRSHQEFGKLRHHIWSLLQQYSKEVQ
jgi:NitT/TauT family transport system ATP-binding protein